MLDKLILKKTFKLNNFSEMVCHGYLYLGTGIVSSGY